MGTACRDASRYRLQVELQLRALLLSGSVLCALCPRLVLTRYHHISTESSAHNSTELISTDPNLFCDSPGSGLFLVSALALKVNHFLLWQQSQNVRPAVRSLLHRSVIHEPEFEECLKFLRSCPVPSWSRQDFVKTNSRVQKSYLTRMTKSSQGFFLSRTYSVHTYIVPICKRTKPPLSNL
ncbi:hypothetical protein BKA67DRAFT_6366 [Truncatella angustata]|uniref:Uncharacterized protein n=1 Tax=Truncatella angustata TaxID=152316 RepID=A0A9P9A140_9PEZI|nr:uncharacterized protein BKA67DRAFT_6366 [Truncatella angustata]KAH6659116.1 hypothetical protein BKA67DRAFT_6366 [Truncatella angustata]